MMEKLIDSKIKEIFKKKSIFCSVHNYAPKDLAKKIKTCVNKINWVSAFLKPLNLKITITEIE